MQVSSSELSAEAIAACGWEEVINAAKSRDCFEYVRGLLEAQAKVLAEENYARADALGLLARVCGLMLWSHTDDVFAPRDRVDDLSEHDLDVLASFVKSISDAELQARVADILWLRRHDRHAAEAAVRAYLGSATTLENPTEWSTGFARVERALRLAASLGKKSALFADVIAYIEQALRRLDGTDPLYLSASLMDLLLEHRVGDDPRKYASIASATAVRAVREHDWWRADRLHVIAARWFELGGDVDGGRASRIAAAEGFVSMAAEKAAQGQPGPAAIHIQHAVGAYRRIGRAAERVEELLRLLREYQTQALNGFRSVGTTVDLSDEARRAIDAVHGKPTLFDAVVALATLYKSPSVATMKQTIRELASATPLQFLMSRVIVEPSTGRTTGRRGSALDATGADALDTTIFEHAQMTQHLTASLVEVARRAICEEHPVSDRELLPLVHGSPFVPPGRAERFTRGLAAGLRGDFMVSTALLVPQIENSLRFVVETHGGRAYTLDEDGVQNALQLEHLLGLDLVKEMLGEDIVFDLRGLLIERFGTNLRNLEAHGLLDDAYYRSTRMSYFWWLTLRLCVLFALVASGRAPVSNDSPSESVKPDA